MIIIFGAGASWDSGCTYPHKPPLGNDLIDHIHSFTFCTENQVEKYYPIFKKGFEIGIEMLRKDSKYSEYIFLKNLGRYFSQFRIYNKNNYEILLNHYISIERKLVVITTNYDLLIEESLSQENIPFSYYPFKVDINWFLECFFNFAFCFKDL